MSVKHGRRSMLGSSGKYQLFFPISIVIYPELTSADIVSCRPLWENSK